MIVGVGLVAGGLAELASVVAPGVAYVALVPGMAAMGAGSALFFAPVAATVLGAVAPTEQGQASGVATDGARAGCRRRDRRADVGLRAVRRPDLRQPGFSPGSGLPCGGVPRSLPRACPWRWPCRADRGCTGWRDDRPTEVIGAT